MNVTGAVRSPSHYLMDPSSTLIDALARAWRQDLDLSDRLALARGLWDTNVHEGRIAAADEERGKPDPAVYLTTVDRLGVAPGDQVVIGIRNQALVRASLAAYLLPLLMLIGASGAASLFLRYPFSIIHASTSSPETSASMWPSTSTQGDSG